MIQILAFAEDVEDPHHRKEQPEDLQQREEVWNVREPIIGKKIWLKTHVIERNNSKIRNREKNNEM